MKKKLVTWELISRSLQQGIPVMLLYVVQSDGSSPGRQGFFMAVNAVGEMAGSIGGGIMEHKFVEMAKEQLTQEAELSTVRRQVHDKSSPKDQSGMICSGAQTILLYRVRSCDEPLIQQIIDCLVHFKKGVLALSPAGLNFSAGTGSLKFIMHGPEDWSYTEPMGYRDHLYLAGGGHCSLAFSRIMSMLDFYIHVYDNRPQLNTFLENDFAHEKIIVEDYSLLKDLIPEGAHHYVVVMTMGYRSDDLVIRALLHKQFRYLGVLGSQAKIKQLFEEYKAAGIPAQVLHNIHAPIGMPISSRTPEEIAISIAAEIIRERNRPGNG
ncbi:XdhC family protein [Chitinophaga sancti]|uniref:Xanthine dehydrogenase accessory factor n=1 Tax=Chitinophaga sancti TaxID=1004 RepID=A0A1K1SS62_9BACT|nr:XdhC/CoxI family protein [Chitinophaga sancti]WQD65314.1 XdhC family protein [Chitinophaga sancti]WQG89062.1 XdhC family protein [Chitinophaga sancti]SFW86927.1 xanthine dehydrogenase accessory factor [Chitinophaga sancti]